MKVDAYPLVAAAALLPAASALSFNFPTCSNRHFAITRTSTHYVTSTSTHYFPAHPTTHVIGTTTKTVNGGIKHTSTTSTVTIPTKTNTITKAPTTTTYYATVTATDTDDGDTTTLDASTSTVTSTAGFTPAAWSLPTASAKKVKRGLLNGVICTIDKDIVAGVVVTQKPTYILKPAVTVTDSVQTSTVFTFKATVNVGPTVTAYLRTTIITSQITKTVTQTTTTTTTPLQTETPDAVVFYQACGAANLLDYTLATTTDSSAGSSPSSSTGGSSASTTSVDGSAATAPTDSGSASSSTVTDGSTPSTPTDSGSASSSTTPDGSAPTTDSDRKKASSKFVGRRGLGFNKRAYVNTGINTIVIKQGGDVMGVNADPVDSAADCCVACQNNALCAGSYFTADGSCTLLVANSCGTGQIWNAGSYFYDSSNLIDAGSGITVSNGNCGTWSYGGASAAASS